MTSDGITSAVPAAPLVRHAAPDAVLALPDLEAVEATVRRAIDERRPDLLSLVGNGEFSIAIRWTEGTTAWVVKRVPPFPSRSLATQYVELTEAYLQVLAQHDVRLVATNLHRVERPDGATVVYHVQPLLDAASLASNVLRMSAPSPSHPIVIAVIDAIARVVRREVGFDGQFANWYWHQGEVWQLDFSTPLLLDADQRIRFDPDGFLREYPAPLRRLVEREFVKIAPRYTDAAFVMTDLVTQLHREGLLAWSDAVIAAARDRHGIAVSADEAAKRFAEEARFYPTLLRLKRLQRGWMQRTGRRYDTLLPATTGFGR